MPFKTIQQFKSNQLRVRKAGLPPLISFERLMN
jgi:hypothetical protein